MYLALTAQAAAEHAPSVLEVKSHTTQHYRSEKFLTDAGLPLTPFRTIFNSDDSARCC